MDSLNEKSGGLIRETDQNSTVISVITEIGIIEQLAFMRLEQQLPKGVRISQFSLLNHLLSLSLSNARLILFEPLLLADEVYLIY